MHAQMHKRKKKKKIKIFIPGKQFSDLWVKITIEGRRGGGVSRSRKENPEK